jgi:hypothetical protein
MHPMPRAFAAAALATSVGLAGCHTVGTAGRSAGEAVGTTVEKTGEAAGAAARGAGDVIDDTADAVKEDVD